MKQAAGTLLYRITSDGLDVLLVHPSGNYNRKAPWSIPKGQVDGEDSLEATARRETLEEAGVATGPLTYAGYADYRRSSKRVHCFVGPLPDGAFPHPASWEVDRAEMVPLDRARAIIHPDQLAFLGRITAVVNGLAT